MNLLVIALTACSLLDATAAFGDLQIDSSFIDSATNIAVELNNMAVNRNREENRLTMDYLGNATVELDEMVRNAGVEFREMTQDIRYELTTSHEALKAIYVASAHLAEHTVQMTERAQDEFARYKVCNKMFDDFCHTYLLEGLDMITETMDYSRVVVSKSNALFSKVTSSLHHSNDELLTVDLNLSYWMNRLNADAFQDFADEVEKPNWFCKDVYATPFFGDLFCPSSAPQIRKSMKSLKSRLYQAHTTSTMILDHNEITRNLIEEQVARLEEEQLAMLLWGMELDEFGRVHGRYTGCGGEEELYEISRGNRLAYMLEDLQDVARVATEYKKIHEEGKPSEPYVRTLNTRFTRILADTRVIKDSIDKLVLESQS